MQAQIIEGFRLSPQQRRLWSLQQDSPVYHAQCALLLEGDLRTEIFRESVQAVINRHEILRTTFHLPTGMRVPFQVVRDSSIPSWHSVDLSGFSHEEQEAKIQDLFQEQACLPFNFEQGPLLRLSILTLSAHKLVVFISLPSLCADARTLANLVCEISQYYAARIKGEEVSGEEQRYVQFSEWQNELLEVQHETGKDYWGRLGLSTLPALKLPFENRSPAKPAFKPAFLTLPIKPDIVAGIEAFIRKYDTSTLVFLLACWQTLLWRLTGQPDVVIATGFDGRKFEELHGALGLFAQSLPIRGHCERNSQFSEILSQAREATRDAYEWQEYFTTDTSVGSGEDSADSALFPIGFEFEEQLSKYNADGVSFSLYRQRVCIDRFKVKLCCVQTADSLITEFHYDSHLFLADDIERLAEQFHTLLKSALNDPGTAISKLEILSDVERQRLVVEWNNTKTGSPKEKCVQQRFEEQAERTPDNIAVAYEDQQLTYRELNCRANQLARYLQKLGVGPEAPVAICVERSLEMVIGLLGVLKAGGAYVPLDPVLPGERLNFMLEDTQAPVLLTQQKVVESLQKYRGKLVCLDTNWNMIAQHSRDNITSEATSKNLAYVLFTSGSTGKPKGVTVEHRQLLNYLDGILEKLDLPAGAGFATVSTFAADLGNTAIFPSLCAGGCLHIVSQERASDPDALGDYFARHPIDCLKIVPSHLETLLASPCPERVLPRKRLVLGGEAASWNLIKKLQELAPDCVILNHYGPTETTVGVITYRVEKGQIDGRSATLPIGRAISNTEIYLLDSRLRPVPIWVPGELYIGGDSVTRGYLNRPELTAERFIPNPFGAGSRSRLYKTGDLARYLPGGNIEFLGRIDNQVKIRGFRIELGEIEAVLGQHPGVREAVIIAREDTPGDKRLVAYVACDRKETATISDLRGFLRERLPDYMLPSTFVFLDALPLSPNGKVDRRSLPRPDGARPELEKAFAAPRTPSEEVLARIWAEVLRLDRIGVHDNFFDLGGHSLLAAQIVSRLREAFHQEIPLRSLFEAPTVAGLAERIETARQGPLNLTPPPLLPLPCEKECPQSFSQQRFWFLNQLEPNSFIYNHPCGFRLEGPLNVKALEQALEEIVRRHEPLRTTFSTRHGEPVQVVADQWQVKLPIIDLTELPDADLDAEVQRLFENEFRLPFNLSSDLMLRATLLRLSAQEHVLFLTIHHIAFDHWSIEVLYRELSLIYKAFSAGNPCPLPELPIQYRHYAIWQRKMLQDAALENHLAYWKQQLGDSPPVLHLPSDYPRPRVQTFRGTRMSWIVPKGVAGTLKAIGQETGVTLFMTLLAAFKVLLHRLTGQDDIVVGSPVAGRDRSETENLIGLFLNTVVLRTNLSGNPTFRELLTRVREVAVGAYDHRDLPFEKLLEELKPKRDLSRTPLFQVLFNMYNFEEPKLSLDGLSVRHLNITKPVSLFDLTVYVREGDDATRISVVYNTDIFEHNRMTELLEQYEILLAQIVERPDESISRFSLVTPRARAILPHPAQPLGRESVEPVHVRFSRQAQRVPDRAAVLSQGSAWSYRDLEYRSNQLAHCLISSGIQPGEIVAIYAHRSASLVWALLGILKAGGAFAILDPAYPAQRLIDHVQVAKPRGSIVLEGAGTPPQDLEKLFSAMPCRLVLPELKRAVGQDPLRELAQFDPGLSVDPDGLAYVAFTSGTAARPKAILGTHRPLSHFLRWHCGTFDLRETDRFSLLSGLSHDPLLRDIFTPLWLGATLCIPDSSDISSGRLTDWINQNEISVAHLTPAMGELLTSDAGAMGHRHASLRYVFFGGDVLTNQHVVRVRRFAPSATCVNFYGATETPQAMGYFVALNQGEMAADDGSASFKTIIPLGQGIEDVQLLVLNPSPQLAGVGEVGEIYVRTPYLAKGYLEDDALTQDRFTPDPFTKVPGDRLYRTGDMGRYLPDGMVEFAGRNDQQVKIRGFRIELGEIETVLGQHPAVRETVVMGREDGVGDTRLVAYVVSTPNQAVQISELRSFLKQKLPDYMLPSAFVFLDALPLTPNGKVDRKALPAPDPTRPELEKAFIAPRDTLELQLTKIWEKLLDIKRIGVRDNFFDLGGHSLLAVRLFAQIEKLSGKKLPLVTLFQAPTVEHLADILRQESWEAPWSSLVAIQPGGSKPPFFGVHAHEGNILFYRDLVLRLGPDQPFYGLQAQGLDGKQMPYTRVEEMAAHYVKEIRTLQPKGPYFLGGYCFGGVVAFEMVQQLHAQGERVALLALFDAYAPGYLRLSPKSVSFRDRLRHFVGKVRHHWGNLSLLGPKEKLDYIKGRLERMAYWLYISMGFPLPPARQQILNAMRQASRNYRPQLYPGGVSLFRGGRQLAGYDDDPQWGWSKLAAGGVEVHRIASHDGAIFLEPHVRVLAEQLRVCLANGSADEQPASDSAIHGRSTSSQNRTRPGK